VQEIVGHASFSTMMQRDAHLLDGAHNAAAKKVNRLFEDERTSVVPQTQ
jgi:hypothetical protein